MLGWIEDINLDPRQTSSRLAAMQPGENWNYNGECFTEVGSGSSQCRSDDEHSELEVIWIRDGIVKFAGCGPEPSGDVVEVLAYASRSRTAVRLLT
jgi:hypothetical protein